MELHIYPQAEQACQAAALMIADCLVRKPDAVLGLATGASPVPAYQELIRLYQRGVVSFSRATSFNLDEYVGLEPEHPCSYHHFMREQLFDHVDMRPEAIHVPDGQAADLALAAAAYDIAIDRTGGIDVQLLGIGRNGHIGFNEPGNCFLTECHVVRLTESTRQANRHFFSSEEEVPREAVSLGVGPILRAKTVLLIATGKEKADAVRDAIQGPIDPAVQASILQVHADVHFFLDEAAAAKL
ncbi:MAG: glucosamine-6-phosphate deaminase [Clostridia bacterium]|nr:glucosamine-6-phosphate deaminase [Clostridia bacterium]